MKLKTLQEARYAGEHPVIARIEKAIKDRSHANFWDIEERDVGLLVKQLNKKYGNAATGDAQTLDPATHLMRPTSYHWTSGTDYGISLGHDEEYSPPYGVEVYQL